MNRLIISIAFVFVSIFSSMAQHTCTQKFLSSTNEDVQRTFSERAYEWENNQVLKVKFVLGGTAKLKSKVKKYADEWTEKTGIQFDFVSTGDADIRISFYPESRDQGSWSYLGTEALRVPKNEATMNYGWLTDYSAEREIARVVLHEFGHALGLPHEHQHPDCPIVWDEEEVLKDMSNWSEEQVEYNIFRKYSHSVTRTTPYDTESIMHYEIPESWTIGNFSVDWNTSLSNSDLTLIEKMYPLVIEVDNDGDGFNSEEDCDDNNALINPNAEEIPNNDIDEDCDGIALIIDEDGDGFNSDEDCDDTDFFVNPDAPERLDNNKDDNCDGLVDEKDEDGDGFLTYKACDWEECPMLDCDDTNPDIYPGARDLVNNGIDENCSGKDNIVIWQMFPGGVEEKKVLNRMEGLTTKMEILKVVDYDGDGMTDIFRANGNNWVYFNNGKEEITQLEKEVNLVAKNIRLGDFDGDGTMDILNATGTVWRIAYGGKKPWVVIKENTATKERLHIGDFDGDGKDDVAVISVQKVKYASGGTGDFIFAEIAPTYKEFGFLIGDFNGDGQDDIFNGNGEEWRVLYGATGEWQVLRKQATTTDELGVGYFNEADADGNPDTIADIFKATGEEWRVWYGGKGAKQVLKTMSETAVFLGDFDGDGRTDVFRIRTLGE